MFLFKKIITPLFYPLTLCLVLMAAGLFLLWFTRRQRGGRILVTIGIVMLAVVSSGPVSDRILGPLERSFPALMTVQEKVKWIVVLGGGHTSDPVLPVTSRISPESLHRLTEAIRIYRSLPGAKLILSGGAVFDPASEAEIFYQTARTIGIPSRDLLLSDQARDTEEEARHIREMVGDDPLVLVTSASHMPRAVALFRKRGMNPIPAPAAHLVKRRSGPVPEDFYPSAMALLKTQMAIREYLGMAWLKLSGKL
jgi:uncharacterized SAM-binding protein YcdF (DUF218 family)